MRPAFLAIAVSAAFAGNSLCASAQSRDAEIAELKAQIVALIQRVEELEARTEAQSGINLDTAQQLDKVVKASAKPESKGGIKVTSADGE